MQIRLLSAVFVAIVLAGCAGDDDGGGGRSGGGGGSPTGSVSGTITPFAEYPVVTGAEVSDSTAASPLQVTGPKAGELLFVLGTLSSSDTADRVTFTEGNAATYNAKISWLDGTNQDVDLTVSRFDGTSTTNLLTLNGTTNPEFGNFSVAGGAGATIIFDITLFSGAGTQWRLDVTVLSGSPLTMMQPGPDFAKDEYDAMEVALAGYEAVPDRLLVTFEKNVSLQAYFDILASVGFTPVRTLSGGAIVAQRQQPTSLDPLRSSKSHLVELANLSAHLSLHPDVAVAEPDFICEHYLTPNDPHFSAYQSWHYNAMNLPAAWNITTGSASVIVAVIDTGIALGHPDLAGRLIGGYDFISDPQNALDGNGIDSNPDDPGDKPGQGSSFHGTHVAGTIGAASNNSVGGAGVDWNCRLMPLRVLGAAGGAQSDIAEAVLYAARLTNVSGTLPPNRAHVINMSLGGKGSTTVYQNAITAAFNAGCTIIAAAGNDAQQDNTPNFPAAYTEVIAVGAINRNYSRAVYSNTASGTTLCAPGGQQTFPFSNQDGVFSTWRDDTATPAVNKYQWLQGTSMAAPHVAGVAALMLAVNGALTPTNIRTLLTGTALDLGTSGYDAEYGFGLVRAEAALVAAGGTLPANPPTAAVTNSVVLVPAGATTAYTSVVNIGGGTLSVSNPQALHFGTENWLGVSLQQSGSQVLVVLSINQGLLTNGNLYYALASVATNDASAPVVLIAVLVNKLAPKAVTYQVRVRAVNATTGQVDGEVFTSAASSFNYSIQGLDPADYVVVGFVDRDTSGSLTHNDLVGAYPSMTIPTPVSVVGGSTTSAVNFPLERHTVGITAVGAATAVP
ncbi:MAG: hypothetical protein BroJett014_32550 [Planctomycetota bacterium]|nr:MAG: hypothetical protein BroJett014_32550 [Planctomycetota bacterium]